MRIKIAILFLFVFSALAQTMRVDGRVYLEGETVHDSIEVAFERTAPSPLSYTVFTNATGYYSNDIVIGIYNVTLSKPNYLSVYLEDISVYSSTTLPDTTLEFGGLSGALAGTLAMGTYEVGMDIYVPVGETLVIEPGTILHFRDNVEFTVNGLLLAEGTETDSIIFTRIDSTSPRWGGILLEDGADNSRISYCVLEYSYPYGIKVSNVDGYLITNSMFEHCVAYALNIEYSEGRIQEVLIQNNYSGIYLEADESIISKTIIQNNTRKGIAIGWGKSTSIENCRIINNTNWESEDAGIYCLSCNPETRIVNTHIIGNTKGGGILLGFYAPTILNCLIADNYPFGISSGSLDPDFFNNNLWNNGSNFLGSGSEWLGVNVTTNSNGDSCDPYYNIQFDPMFADTATGDYHLLEGSRCLDAGDEFVIISSDTFWAPLEDFEGTLRPFGPRWDIGAYEGYVSGIGELPAERPTNLSLSAYPNPFNSSVRISIDCRGLIDQTPAVEVFDIAGRMVGRIPPAPLNKGGVEQSEQGVYIWQPASSIGSGVYLVRARFGDNMVAEKIVYIK